MPLRRHLISIVAALSHAEVPEYSNYNSLQVEVLHRMARGFLIPAASTYSKSLDDVSGLTLGGDTPNPFDWSSSWGPRDFDVTHNAHLSYVWELPRGVAQGLRPGELPGAGESGFHKALLHDWELTGILTARTGTGFSVFSGQDIALSGAGDQTADVVGDPRRDHSSRSGLRPRRLPCRKRGSSATAAGTTCGDLVLGT